MEQEVSSKAKQAKRNRSVGNTLEREERKFWESIGYPSDIASKKLDDMKIDVANIPVGIQCKKGYDKGFDYYKLLKQMLHLSTKNEFKGKPLFIRHQTNGNKKDMYVMFKNTFIDMIQKKIKNFELLEVILGCPDIHITDKIVEVNTKYFRNYLTMIYELKD